MPRLVDGNWWVDTTGTVPHELLDKLNAESREINAMGFQLGGAIFANSASDGIQVATKFGNENGIGFADKDNGIAIVVFTEKAGTNGEKPAMSIAVGKGLEGTLNDAKTGRFMDNYFVPTRKEGRWQEGLLATVQALKRYLQDPNADEFKEKPLDPAIIWLFVICLVLLVMGIVFDFIFTGGQITGAIIVGIASGSSSSGGGGGFGGGGASR